MLTILDIHLFLRLVRYLPVEDTINLCIVNKQFYNYATLDKFNNHWKLLMYEVYSHVYNYQSKLKQITGPNYVVYTKMITQIDRVSQAIVQHRFGLYHVYLSINDHFKRRRDIGAYCLAMWILNRPNAHTLGVLPAPFYLLPNGLQDDQTNLFQAARASLSTGDLNIMIAFMLSYGYINGAEKMISLGANINSIYQMTHYSEHCYVNQEITEYLIQRGVDVTVKYHKTFRKACKYGSLDTVQYLLNYFRNNNIDFNINILSGYSLKIAIRTQNKEMVECLLNHGADIEIDQGAPLTYASRSGNLEMVKLLVSRGANIHANQEKALRCAARWSYLNIIRYLIEQGADFNQPMIIEKIFWRLNMNHFLSDTDVTLNFLEFLLQRGANIHALDYYLFRRASQYGNLKLVMFLLDKGANVHSQKDYALNWARQNKHQHVVDYLSKF